MHSEAYTVIFFFFFFFFFWKLEEEDEGHGIELYKIFKVIEKPLGPVFPIGMHIYWKVALSHPAHHVH